jgi:NitT/TauT family transport system substrate-binding protein
MRNMSRTTGKVTALVCGIGLVAGLASCGSDDQTGKTGASGGLKTINVGTTLVGSLTALPLWYADSAGYLKDHGLNLKLTEFSGGSALTTAMLSHDLDFGASAFQGVIAAKSQGADLVTMANMTQRPGLAMVARNAVADRIHGYADMKGLKLGISKYGSGSDAIVRVGLERAGLDPDKDVKIVEVGSTTTALAALKSGSADAILVADPVIAQTVKAGLGKVVWDGRKTEDAKQVFPPDGEYSIISMVTRQDEIDKDPDLVKRLGAALAQACTKMASSTPAQIAQVMLPKYKSGQPDAVYEQQLEANRDVTSPDCKLQPAAAKAVLESTIAVDPKVKDKNIDVDSLYTNEFVAQG